MKSQWSLKKEEEEKKNYANKFNEWVSKQETKINKELFKNHLFFQTPSGLLKELYKTNDKEKNRPLVSVINSGLKDLKDKIKEMSEEERKIEKPDKIVKVVKRILNFNKKKPKRKRFKNFNTKPNA